MKRDAIVQDLSLSRQQGADSLKHSVQLSKNSTVTARDIRYKNPDNDPRGPYLLADVTSPFVRPVLQYEWHGQLPPQGRSWRYSKARAEDLEAEGRIVLSPSGRPRIKRYLSEVVRNNDVETDVRAFSPLEVIVRTAMKAIASEIAKNPQCLRDVEWRDLERVMREVFEQLGFETELTRSGKDGGFDIRLECVERGETQVFLVEIKHWLASGKKPGRKVLSALFDVVATAGEKTKGLLISSTGFSSTALTGRTEVEQRTVRAAGQNKLVSLCQNYIQSIDGIFLPTTELSEMLLEGSS